MQLDNTEIQFLVQVVYAANEAVNDFVLLGLYLAQNVIHKFQKDFINIEIILGTRFAVAHSTYSRGKLQEKIQQNKNFQKENESCTMKEHTILFN